MFETDVDDNQFFEFLQDLGVLRVVTNIDQLDISGSELDFEYAVTDNLTLDGGLVSLMEKLRKMLIDQILLAIMLR